MSDIKYEIVKQIGVLSKAAPALSTAEESGGRSMSTRMDPYHGTTQQKESQGL